MTVRIIRVSWQRFDSSHSQLGSFSNSREPLHLTSLQAPAFFARGGLLLMVFMWLPQRTRLLPRLLCHYCLPPRAQIGSRIPASVLPPYHFGHIWSATSPSSLSPEKLQSLDFNSLWINAFINWCFKEIMLKDITALKGKFHFYLSSPFLLLPTSIIEVFMFITMLLRE